mgnify:CR=1 FL=1
MVSTVTTKHARIVLVTLAAVLLGASADAPQEWVSKPAPNCPFPRSREITGIAFTGRHAEYTDADTWYPSWAADGNQYSPFTDGTVDQVTSRSYGDPDKLTTGHARILGDDPLQLKVEPIGLHTASARPYEGRYPCGSLVHNGVWYYGTYCLTRKDPHLNWDVMGPFVGFRISHDYGQTWIDTPRTPGNPLFGEPSQKGGKVKFGSPHFVDFGRNMEHSPDGKAYLVGHGATRPDAQLSWIGGDQVYLCRVTPSPANMNDPARYEFFAGRDAAGQPKWSRDFADIRPLVEWQDRTGCVTMTYIAPLRKYLMWITDGFPTIATMNTWALESDRITGPWKLVTFMQKFGEQGYFVNIPSKFISKDGRTAWLCYSTNFTRDQKTNPPGGRYAMSLQEIRLMGAQ